MDVLPGFKPCGCTCHDGSQVMCGCYGGCCPFPRGSKRVKARCESCGIWVSEVAMANHAHTPYAPAVPLAPKFTFPAINPVYSNVKGTPR